ncbi:SHOCT domain-containing protein [Erwinia sp. CPCC 100877]|nr:SHOCT domain-containing protein [Erwinia sp. CPCC 100877]
MGLFKSKEEKRKLKEAKTLNKQKQSDLKDYFIKNHDLALADFLFNDREKAMYIKKSMMNNKATLVEYSDLISYTAIFEGGTIKKHHGITRAVVGGMLAGPVGALVGAGTGGKEFNSIKRLGVMLHMSDNKSFKYLLLNSEAKTDSLIGKTHMDAYNKIAAKLDQIIAANNSMSVQITSSTDEIRKFKQLLNDGIITEEFNTKKKQLLGL